MRSLLSSYGKIRQQQQNTGSSNSAKKEEKERRKALILQTLTESIAETGTSLTIQQKLILSQAGEYLNSMPDEEVISFCSLIKRTVERIEAIYAPDTTGTISD